MRYRVAIFALVAVLGAVGVHFAVDHFTREPPDYAEIEPGLYVGAYVDEPPPGTQAVLNLCEMDDSYKAEVHRWKPIRDSAPAPSLDWLREQVDFIAAERKVKHGVFVHCFQGASRSGMVVVAYLMAEKGWSRDEAMRFVRAKRPGLRPNPAFVELLDQWERNLKQ